MHLNEFSICSRHNFRAVALGPNSASSRLHPRNANQAVEPALTIQMSHQRMRERENWNWNQEVRKEREREISRKSNSKVPLHITDRHHTLHPELKCKSRTKLKAANQRETFYQLVHKDTQESCWYWPTQPCTDSHFKRKDS